MEDASWLPISTAFIASALPSLVLFRFITTPPTNPTHANPTTPADIPILLVSTSLASAPPYALQALSLALQLLHAPPEKAGSSAYLQCFFMSMVERTHWFPLQSSEAQEKTPKQLQVEA